MPSAIDTISSRLWKKLSSKVYRDAFVSSGLLTGLGAQIHALRKRAGWTQQELSEATGMAQARISVLENATAENISLATLKRIASAFDVALVVRFVRFSEVVEWTTHLNEERLAPASFANDNLAEEEDRSLEVIWPTEAHGTLLHLETVPDVGARIPVEISREVLRVHLAKHLEGPHGRAFALWAKDETGHVETISHEPQISEAERFAATSVERFLQKQEVRVES